MGTRYHAILKHLNVDVLGVDIDSHFSVIKTAAETSDGIIIATPTDTHEEFIRSFMHLKKPILCEKPITKNIKALRALICDLREAKTNFTMMYQYKELVEPSASGWSYYNYFRHGSDGLIWDCIQIIGLANGAIRIEGRSPVWKCWINGQGLSLAQMDHAYVSYVKKWLKKPGQDLQEILSVHQKTADYLGSNGHG
jgi:hypothetical protein